jgi:glucosamine-6-phosphate deaminase
MSPKETEITKRVDQAKVTILPTDEAMGAAAAGHAAHLIRAAILEQGHARIMVGTGNSQRSLIDHLVDKEKVEWSRVTVFHMDEYVGIDRDHPASFRRWLRTRVAERAHPKHMHYIEGDAGPPAAELTRYSALLAEAPLDVAFVGFGENGHIAFNDPGVADFKDPQRVKIVTLDERCRRQQVGEGHFKDLAAVPTQAMTVTCSELLAVRAWVCCVPEARKAEAVRNALEGPIGTACPASIVRRHPNAHVFLDADSSAQLSWNRGT